jgi:hypothetical protein
MIELIVGLGVVAVALMVRVIVVARRAAHEGVSRQRVSHQWIDDNIYTREGGDR